MNHQRSYTEYRLELPPVPGTEQEIRFEEKLAAFNSFMQSDEVRDAYQPPYILEGFKAPQEGLVARFKSLFRRTDDTPFKI